MIENSSFTSDKSVARWLYLGVFMLMVQILLGGITRLTESGLSITEWNPVTGILPPLNMHQWQVEFDKYKTTDQFRYINSEFTLHDFKNIFFWEWLHRAWARLMGIVFIIGFIYFLIKKKLRSNMIIPFIILFLLGIIQGAIGWIMVKSGLMPEKMFVGHIQLTVHFISALVLLCYTLWFALSLSVKKTVLVFNSPLRNWTLIILIFVFFQLIYGGFMAGLHAGAVAPTWPQINGQWIPANMNRLSPARSNFTDNKITIQFIHRGLAYIILLLMVVWVVKMKNINGSDLFQKLKWIPPVLLLLQIVLGIFTVINSPFPNKLVFFGVAHQLNAILLLMSLIIMIFMVRSRQSAVVN